MKLSNRVGLLAVVVMGLLSGCGGGDSVVGSSATPASVLSGTAAVGAPIVGGTITVKCAAGSALATTTTGLTGAWQVTLTGQTLPCAVQVSGGTINTLLNTVAYHSIATTAGTLNLSPITDLVIANLASAPITSTWFSGLNATAFNALTVNAVNAALALLALNNINPLTVTFNPVSGNAMDDILTALQAAFANTNVNLAALRAAAAGANFNTPAGFNAALSAGYGGTTSGAAAGATVPGAPTVATATAISATQINVSWQAVSGATRYNVYRATAPNVALSAANKVTSIAVTSNAYSDVTGLAASTAYYYKVTALNSVGESVLGSNEVTATTSAAAAGGGGTPGTLVASGTLTGFPSGLSFTAGSIVVNPLFASFGSPPRQDASFFIQNSDKSISIIVDGEVINGVGGPRALGMNVQTTAQDATGFSALYEWNTAPLCNDSTFPANCVPMAGVVIDRVGKKITFTNAVLTLPFGAKAVAFGNLTLNGTVSW